MNHKTDSNKETPANELIKYSQFRSWLRHHAIVFQDSFQRQLAEPISSLLTWLVIGIALALPAVLYTILSNVEGVSQKWDNGTRILLFLDKEITTEQGEDVAKKILSRADIIKADFVSVEDALKFFKRNSGLGEALKNIDRNPFPPSIEVQYKESLSPIKVKDLIKNLRKRPGVQSVQLDMAWVQRLYRFMQVGKRLTLILICLLSLGVLLVVGNTVRLSIENRREEISIIKLIGASDSFVRRPFLYSGFWLGLGGGLIAWLVIFLTSSFLKEPVHRLMNLYGSNFQLLSLTTTDIIGLICSGILLGWLGAWLVVSHYLSEIEPT